MQPNKLVIYGKVISIEESHRVVGSVFYRYLISIPRMSGTCDIVPLIVSDKLLYRNKIAVNDYITSIGEVRTLNKESNNKTKLLVFGFANSIKVIKEAEFNEVQNKNVVYLEGYIVRNPISRETTKGVYITDLIIAHNRSYKKVSYIPAIAWGIQSQYAKHLHVGAYVLATGRFQSRTYYSNNEEKIVYELSILSIEESQPAKKEVLV